jgi:hypothetical protein
MHDGEESDSGIVTMKGSNEGAYVLEEKPGVKAADQGEHDGATHALDAERG